MRPLEPSLSIGLGWKPCCVRLYSTKANADGRRSVLGLAPRPAARSAVVHKETLILTERERLGLVVGLAGCLGAAAVVLGSVRNRAPTPPSKLGAETSPALPGCPEKMGSPAKGDSVGVRGRVAP